MQISGPDPRLTGSESLIHTQRLAFFFFFLFKLAPYVILMHRKLGTSGESS